MNPRKALILFTLMLIGEGVFLLPFVVARIFRPTFLTVFDITNLELGTAFSLYGIVAMVSYFVGGPIADRYSPKRLLIVSLLTTAAAGVIMGFIPSLTTLTLLYGFWGVSTILLFWAGYIKAIRQFGEEHTQGTSYGVVDGGRGLVAAVIASGSVFLLDFFLPVEVELASREHLSDALGKIIFLFSGVLVASAVLVGYVLPDDSPENRTRSDRLSLEGVKIVIRLKSAWYQSIILLCAYVGYKSIDVFGLYASDVFGYNDVNAAHLATISFWLRPIGAVGAGIMGDQFGHSRMTRICFILLIAGSAVISTGILENGMEAMIVITIASTSLGIYGLRGLYYALFQESRIPLSITGSAIGFISVIGYTPDVFMGPLTGVILDNNPGELGHQYLFGVVVIFGIIGLVAAHFFQKDVLKN